MQSYVGHNLAVAGPIFLYALTRLFAAKTGTAVHPVLPGVCVGKLAPG